MRVHKALVDDLLGALGRVHFTAAKANALSALTTVEAAILDGATCTAAEVNKLDGLGSTTAEVDFACDLSARKQTITASGAITDNVNIIELNHASTPIAATITYFDRHAGLLVIRDVSTGTQSHTVEIVTPGQTFDGTNRKATFDAGGETLFIYVPTGDGTGYNGHLLANIGSVTLGST